MSGLQRGANLESLVQVYGGQLRFTNRQRSAFEIDVPNSYLEASWLGDWEASYDIAVQQLRTYAHALQTDHNPAWSAVTGYYAGFFATRALLFGVGIGHRSIPRVGGAHGGLYEFTISPIAPSVGTSTLLAVKASGGGSHKAAWNSLNGVIGQLMGVGGLDIRSLNILSVVQGLISGPPHVSAYRNTVNYSLDVAMATVAPWSSELRRVRDAAKLEAALGVTAPVRAEHRIELGMLVAMSWLKALYADYLARADRPDRRRSTNRTAAVNGDSVEVAALLTEWL